MNGNPMHQELRSDNNEELTDTFRVLLGLNPNHLCPPEGVGKAGETKNRPFARELLTHMGNSSSMTTIKGEGWGKRSAAYRLYNPTEVQYYRENWLTSV